MIEPSLGFGGRRVLRRARVVRQMLHDAYRVGAKAQELLRRDVKRRRRRHKPDVAIESLHWLIMPEQTDRSSNWLLGGSCGVRLASVSAGTAVPCRLGAQPDAPVSCNSGGDPPRCGFGCVAGSGHWLGQCGEECCGGEDRPGE